MRQSDTATFVIYGCGGHARSVADIALNNGVKKILFVDDNAKENEKIFNFDVVKKMPDNTNNIMIAIGDNQKRSQLNAQFRKKNIFSRNLISNNAYFCKSSTLDIGIFIGHGAHVGPNTHIDTGAILNTRCLIEHDCRIGKYTHIAVNATLAGKCEISDFVMIGAGATIIDSIKICAHVTIGAGAVVVDHIDEPGIYVGIPAKRLKD